MTQQAATQIRSSKEVYPIEIRDPNDRSVSLGTGSAATGSNGRLDQQFRHEFTEEHPSLHLFTLRLLMGLSLFGAVVSFAAYIVH